MSSALAIASVTQVLKDLLNDGMIDHDVTGLINGNVSVTSLPPDLIESGKDSPGQLNLFMYHVSENQGWRNQQYPSVSRGGERLTNPPLALNLHYLLTSFSSEELVGDVLLGYGMQLLHENPVLTRENIRKSLALPSVLSSNSLPANLQAIATSGLAEQVELVKISLEALNTEEMSKLWTAFQVKYRPSAAYVATVVLIESERSTRSALPVRQRNVYIKPFRQAVIDAVHSKAAAAGPVLQGAKILHNHWLALQGHNLKGANVRINIDGALHIPAPDTVHDDHIYFPLPAGIKAGLHGVQVTDLMLMGTPETLHSGSASNVGAFVLSPVIDAVSVLNPESSGSFRSGDLSIDLRPAVEPEQRITVLLNQIGNLPSIAPAAYSFQSRVPAAPPDPSATVIVPFSSVRTGTYLVRVQVDGAESPLQSDPGTGAYNGPKLILS